MMKRIAFVTCEKRPELTEDDAIAASAIERESGCTVCAVPWDRRETSWNEFAAIIIRSPWDYHLRPDEFLAWLKRLEADRALVCNSVPVVRWNLNKTYLCDLAAKGIPTVPTHWIAKGAHVDERVLP